MFVKVGLVEVGVGGRGVVCFEVIGGDVKCFFRGEI